MCLVLARTDRAARSWRRGSGRIAGRSFRIVWAFFEDIVDAYRIVRAVSQVELEVGICFAQIAWRSANLFAPPDPGIGGGLA